MVSTSSLVVGGLLGMWLDMGKRTFGAILTMLANSMIPEAFENGGKIAGLVTVLGFPVAVTV